MTTMTYKGYSARVNFDDRDNIFVGHVLGVRDSIGFHGATVDELRTSLAQAIDHYLAVCAKRGESPDKPYSGKLMLRIPPEVHAKAALAAEASGESINKWVAEVVNEAGSRFIASALDPRVVVVADSRKRRVVDHQSGPDLLVVADGPGIKRLHFVAETKRLHARTGMLSASKSASVRSVTKSASAKHSVARKRKAAKVR